MIIFKKKINLLIYFSILLIFFCNTVINAAENKIILKVENLIVTSYELKNKIKTDLFLRKMGINQKNINEIKQSSYYTLLNLKIKQSELEKFNFEVVKSDVEKQIIAVTSLSLLELKKFFVINEIDFELFYNEVKTEIGWQQYVYTLYGQKIKVNETEINDELNKLIKDQAGVVEYKISEIELLIEDEIKMQDKILFIKKKIAEIGFENTAMQLSISTSASKKGDLGWINEEALSDEIKKIIKVMKVDDISKPIIASQSITILKLSDKKVTKASNADIKKLKENIINRRKNELFNLYSKSLLSKVKNNSLIITYD
jgi:peptidyl-prolyl cis-trans isomerase SurA